MSYDTNQVNALLNEIRLHAGTLASVRTDGGYEGTGGGGYLVLSKGKGVDAVRLPSTRADEEWAIKRIQRYLSIPHSAADGLLGAGQELAGMNPVGAWCLSPARDLPAHEFDTRVPLANPVADARLKALADQLPGVSRIECQLALEGQSNGKLRRRMFIRVLGHGSEERAAMDTGLFAAHSEALISGRSSHAEQNRARCGVWAEQLGVPVDTMPFVLADIVMFTLTCESTCVILNP